MATLLPALLTKFSSLSATVFANTTVPPVFHDQAPEVTTGQLRPPYAIISTEPGDDDLTFESDQIERTVVTIRIWDTDLNLDSAITAVRFNTGGAGDFLGFDCGTLPTLNDGTLLSMLIATTPTKHFDSIDKDGQNTYRAELKYNVDVQRS